MMAGWHIKNLFAKFFNAQSAFRHIAIRAGRDNISVIRAAKGLRYHMVDVEIIFVQQAAAVKAAATSGLID